MDYHIYTDGAYSQQSGNGAWAYIILTDTRYINSDSGKSKYIKAPAIAEDIAIGMACYYLLSFCNILPHKLALILPPTALATIDAVLLIIYL